MLKKGVVFFLLVSLLIPSLIKPNSVQALSNVTTISTNSSNDAVYPQTVSDSNGYLHMVWMEMDGTAPNPGIMYSRWNGDTWSTPLKISENTGFAEIPSIAVDSNNTVHVVWSDKTYGATQDFCGCKLSTVAYRTRSAAGTWSAIESLPVPSGTLLSRLGSVAVDNANTPHVSFYSVSDNFSNTSIYWTQKVAGNWQTPQVVGTNASENTLTSTQWSIIKSDSTGKIHLTYWDTSYGVFYRSNTAGTWSTPVAITTSANLEFPRLGVTPNGEVFITWAEINDTSIRARWTQSGVWQSETTLTTLASRPFYNSGILGITTDSKNRVHVGWGERNVSNKIDIKYRSFLAGTWQTTQNVDLDNDDAMMPFVYPDKWDNQHFAWSELDPISGKWKINYRVAEGTIQTVGAAGGTVTSNPFGITEAILSIPATALAGNTDISIQIGPVPEAVDPLQITLPRAYTFRPHGLVFANGQTATAQIFYTEAELAGADERELKPWFWDSTANGGLGDWVAQAGTVRTAQNRIDANLAHFSLYGISAPLVETRWIKPDSYMDQWHRVIQYEFIMKYKNGNPISPITTPEDLKVVLKKQNGETVLSDLFESSGIHEGTRGTYKGVMLLPKSTVGTFVIEAYLAGSLMSSKTFTISQ